MTERPYQNIWGVVRIGTDTKVAAFVEIGGTLDYPTTVGEGVTISAYCFICPGTTIEDNVFLGPRVTILNDKYPPSYGKHWAPVTIQSGASIGGGAILLPGVTIGRKAQIGAGAVVTHDVPDNETWVGVPAKELR